MSLKHFQILNKIGEGSFSVVYRIRRISDGNDYALKMVHLSDLSEKEKLNALNEIRILASIRHPNVIAFKEVFLEENTSNLCIVMELADAGDLSQKILEHQKRGNLFQESEIWSIFIQLVKGLKALHDLEIFHRDMKSGNIFLNNDGTCKLGDMNVSKVAKKGFLTTQTGTPYYASPEVWKDQPYDYKADIWSLGCVLYEMTTLKPPFKGDDMDTIYRKVIKGVYPRIPAHYSEELSQIIRVLLQVNPNMRLSCNKILQLPIVLRFFEERHLMKPDEGPTLLLKTLRLPQKLQQLHEYLPKPNYFPIKTRFLSKNQFIQFLNGERDDFIDFEMTDRDYAKKLLSLIGKKGSILPRISKTNLIEHHNKRYLNVAPLYEEEIFIIKPMNLLDQISRHYVSKSCTNATKLLDETTLFNKSVVTTIINKSVVSEKPEQTRKIKKNLKLILPKIK